MEKKIKWEKPILRDLHGRITVGQSCYPGGGFETFVICSTNGVGATNDCDSGSGVQT
jgi:hypothetical protein